MGLQENRKFNNKQIKTNKKTRKFKIFKIINKKTNQTKTKQKIKNLIIKIGILYNKTLFIIKVNKMIIIMLIIIIKI